MPGFSAGGTNLVKFYQLDRACIRDFYQPYYKKHYKVHDRGLSSHKKCKQIK